MKIYPPDQPDPTNKLASESLIGCFVILAIILVPFIAGISIGAVSAMYWGCRG